MAKTVNRYISELPQAYQEIARKTLMEMALDFGVTLSNLSLYRTETGNPTAETIDKIVSGAEINCPEAFEEISRRQARLTPEASYRRDGFVSL